MNMDILWLALFLVLIDMSDSSLGLSNAPKDSSTAPQQCKQGLVITPPEFFFT